MEEIELTKAYIKAVEEGNAILRDFINRVQRGDPRVCKPEYSNPRYFEKFGE